MHTPNTNAGLISNKFLLLQLLVLLDIYWRGFYCKRNKIHKWTKAKSYSPEFLHAKRSVPKYKDAVCRKRKLSYKYLSGLVVLQFNNNYVSLTHG